MTSQVAIETGVMKFERLIEAYEKIERKPLRPTYLELAGFPHYENVISNLLAFFLDPAAEHKLGDLVLSAFLTCLGITHGLSNVRIDREVQTKAGRIDILINSDTDVIVVENKIYHHADGNPFADYVTYASSSHPEKKRHFLVLTPFPSALQTKRQEFDKLGFNVLSYSALFAQIQSGMGPYAASASVKYWLLLLDVMQSIENLSKGTSMETSTFNFFKEHSDTLASLLREVAQLRSELRNKVTALHGKFGELAQEKLENIELLSKGAYYREQDGLFDTLYFDIQFPNEARVACDVIIRVTGWEVKIHPRTRANSASLKTVLSSLGMTYKEIDGRFLVTDPKPPSEFAADLEDVATVVIDVLNRLSNKAKQTADMPWVK